MIGGVAGGDVMKGFCGDDIIVGGGGNDVITGGGGDDIIDGDAFLHVALTSYAAGGQIIRQINFDPNGNTAAHHNAANVDTAVFNDVFANYGDGFSLFV